MNGYNFTEEVRHTLAAGLQEAARLQHEYVGTEHLLLGILHVGESFASAVLSRFEIDPDEIRHSIEWQVKRGSRAVSAQQGLPYTSRAKKVLELAMSEAREMRDDFVGTEHLLLGLIREEKGIAAQVLTGVGLTLETVREAVISMREAGDAAQTDTGEHMLASFKDRMATESARQLAELERLQLDSAWLHLRIALELARGTNTPARLERVEDGALVLVLGDDLLRVPVPRPGAVAPPT